MRRLRHYLRFQDGAVVKQGPTLYGGANRTYLDRSVDAWRGFWGRCHYNGGAPRATQGQYQDAQQNHDWLVGHDDFTGVGARDRPGTAGLNGLVNSAISNRMGAVIRAYFYSQNCANEAVMSYIENGTVSLPGVWGGKPYVCALYGVCDIPYFPELSYDGAALDPGEYYTPFGGPPGASDGPAPITFKAIANSSGRNFYDVAYNTYFFSRAIGSGAYAHLNSWKNVSSTSLSYTWQPTPFLPSWNDACFSQLGWSAVPNIPDTELPGGTKGKQIPWKGCQLNKECSFVFSYDWSHA
jgi:hypothetical protein